MNEAVLTNDDLLFDTIECGELYLSSKFIWTCRSPFGHPQHEHYMVRTGTR